MLKKISLILFLVISLIVTVEASITRRINYQGRLTSKDGGSPVSDGSYNITFRIYDAESGGNLLWFGTNSVSVSKGIFNTELGDKTDTDSPAKFSDLAFDKTYYLEMKVGNEVMDKRQKITSAAYAIKAEKADDAVTVSGVGVSTTPTANKILPLDNTAKFPLSTVGLKVYDSGWFLISVGESYSKVHNLGTTRVLMQVYFSINSDGSGFVTIMGCDNTNYNTNLGIVLTGLTISGISIRTGNPYLFNGMGINGENYYPTSGYLRVIMMALE